MIFRIYFRYNLLRFRFFRRTLLLNPGWSSGLIVTDLVGKQSLAMSRNISVNFVHASTRLRILPINDIYFIVHLMIICNTLVHCCRQNAVILATVCSQYASAHASVALDAVSVVILELCAPSAMERWITRAVKPATERLT